MKSQHDKILALMIARKGQQEWFYAPDFQKPGLPPELFVGYEATARMSELAKLYPMMIESKRDGKYRYIRFRFENIDEIFETSGSEMVDFLDQTFLKYGVHKGRHQLQKEKRRVTPLFG